MATCITVGGGINNVIAVYTDTVITEEQLRRNKINTIMVMVAGITVTLPVEDPNRTVVVHQGFEGSGTYTVN